MYSEFPFLYLVVMLAFEQHYFGDLLDTLRLFLMCY